MKKIITVAIASAVFALTGCATIISGSSQVINVQAIDAETHHPIDNAKCEIMDAKGVSYPVTANPGQVTVPRVYGDLSIDCKAPHYWQKSVGGGSSFNAWTLMNVFFWPGAIVDAATGAAKNYPSHITVLMSSKPVEKGANKIKAA